MNNNNQLTLTKEELTMTNLTNNTTNSTTNNTQENTMDTTQMNTNALSSTVAAHLFHQIGNARVSVLLACAVVDATKLVGDLDMPEAFVDLVKHSLASAKLQTSVSGNGSIDVVEHKTTIPEEHVHLALMEAQLAKEDGTIGDRMIQIMEQRTEAYAPTKVGDEFTRRFPNYGIEKGQMGKLAIEAIHAQEASQFTISQVMVDIANRVQTIMGGAEADDEAYVLAGCNAMSAENAYTSEFKADRRIRTYQAACHGPNGQASDRSRALMDLAGVTTEYDIPTVKRVIKAEVMDMVSIPENKVGKLMSKAIANPVDFIIEELGKDKKDRLASKPWSFTKAAMIWSELQKGNRPYIGMAVGLDAKCSGPQLGALMVGDEDIAAACGMTLTKLEDAYQRCITELEKAGFVGFTRGGIKKSFMGVFYGQGWAAFTDVKQLIKDEQFEVVAVLYPEGIVSDDVAKRFHKAVTKSFGKKMCALRQRIAEYNDANIETRTGHMMPDGSRVQMNYKIQHNILDQAIEHDVVCPDVIVTTSEYTYKFIKLALNTLEVNTKNFIRNSFVNMIQATDALIARLIIVHLKRLGAQHIIAVHDCFRVNVTEMHLLEQAIKNAYMDLFGSRTNIKTEDMPLGTDILGMFFEGMQSEVTNPNAKVIPMKQFLDLHGRNIRKMTKIMNVPVTELIEALGTSYYFAK